MKALTEKIRLNVAIFLLLIFTTFNVSAQLSKGDKTIGLSFDMDQSKENSSMYYRGSDSTISNYTFKYKSSSVSINPYYGVMVRNKVMLLLQTGVTVNNRYNANYFYNGNPSRYDQSHSNIWNVGVGNIFYQSVGRQFYLFPKQGLKFEIGNRKTVYYHNNSTQVSVTHIGVKKIDLQAQIGVMYMIRSKFSLNLGLNFLDINYTKERLKQLHLEKDDNSDLIAEKSLNTTIGARGLVLSCGYFF